MGTTPPATTTPVSQPVTSVPAARLASAARAQVDLPEGKVSELRRAWPERLAGVWGATVQGRDRTANAFLGVSAGRVTVPAGPAQAARELAILRPLDGRPWGGGLVYVVTAAGGSSPGFPDTWDAHESPLPTGGTRVTLDMPEAWVAYAAAGGVGPPPAGPSGGGLAPRAPMGTATLDIGPDYALQWRYQFEGHVIDGPSGSPATASPVLSDEQLIAALDGARRRAHAPRSTPSAEPRLLTGHTDVVTVDLWALGPVYVDLGNGDNAAARLSPLGIDWAAPPAALVPLLSAADALPAGLLPADILPTARVAGGELVADVPAPLVEWSAGGASQRSPRVPGVAGEADMARAGRIRMKLDGGLRWVLEVADGASWRPAAGGP